MSQLPDKIIACPVTMTGHIFEVLAGGYDIPALDLKPIRVLDLGANIGSFAIWARHKWQQAEIHCYEPSPSNFELMSKNLEGLTNIVLHPAAVDDHTGQGKLYLGKHNCGESSLYNSGTGVTEESVDVNVISGSSLPEAEILKLDTEGSEWQILSTYPYLGKVQMVVFEWHTPEDRDRCAELLKYHGFDCAEDNRTRYLDRGLQKWGRNIPQPEGVSASSLNILIGMPCYGGLTYATNNRSVLELHDLLNSKGVRHDPRYLPNESLIPRARNYFSNMCLSDKDQFGQSYSHLLFLDVDIGFNARDIESLIALDKDIAALPYSAKDFEWPKIIEAITKHGVTDPEALRRIAGRPIINCTETTNFPVDQPVQFPQLGTGILLIKRKVFEKFAEDERRHYNLMRNENPGSTRSEACDFFQIGINPDTRYYDSEDYRFCLDARKLGFETWLWPNAVTTHTGPYTFWMDIGTQARLNIPLVADPTLVTPKVPVSE